MDGASAYNKIRHGGAAWQRLISTPDSFKTIVCADVNDAYYEPAPRVVETIQRWARCANFASDTQCSRLRESIAAKEVVPMEHVHFGCGSSELLQTLISCFLAAGETLVTLAPTYSEYERCARSCGGLVRYLALEEIRGFAVQMATLRTSAQEARIVVICNPNNPTGQILPRNEMLQFLEGLDARTICLIDEAYIEFCSNDTLIRDTSRFPNLAVIRTFSKCYALSGLRVGYAVLGEELNARFHSVVRPPWLVGLIAAKAAEVALEEFSYVTRMISETNALKAKLIARLRALSRLQPVPSQTSYLLLRLNHDGISSTELCESLAGLGIFVRDCVEFGETMGNRYIRIATQSENHNERIAQGLETFLGRE